MANIVRVSPAEAQKLIDEGYVYIDVRSVPEYEAGHAKGALNVPIMNAGARGLEPNPQFVAVMTALFATDAKLVLGCRSGQRSMRAAEQLVAAGFTALREQRAGHDGSRDAFGAVAERGWAAAGLPTETATPGGSYAELARKAGQ